MICNAMNAAWAPDGFLRATARNASRILAIVEVSVHLSVTPLSPVKTLQNAIFTRESTYCFQRVLAIGILSVCPSIRPSVTRVDQSKTVQARITKFSPSAAWKTLVSEIIKLFHKFEGGHLE